MLPIAATSPAYFLAFFRQGVIMEEQLPNHPHRLDIDQLKYLAHKHFVEGIPTMQLLQQASSEQEKEQIALVALLHVKDDLTVEFHYQQDLAEPMY
jgi:hypothetical protein